MREPKDSWGNPITPWYEEYRIKDQEELNRINDIWQKILEEETKRR